MSRPSLRSLCVTLFSTLLCAAAPGMELIAECEAEESGSVNVFVRTIQASEPVPADPPEGQDIQSPKVPAELSDLSVKLAQLPFSSFSLLASKNETHFLKKRETMQLPNGQTLTFRPMYMDNKRVGLWLNWRDSDGSEILNTRVHFDADDSVVTGTDCAGNKGLILAIKAVAVPTPATSSPGGN